MKKSVVLFLVFALLLSSLLGCTSTPDSTASNATENEDAAEPEKADDAEPEAAEEESTGGISKDTVATLRLAGPGLFTTVGETGTTDLVTGETKPGYQEVISRWNELYPNIKIEVETAPWDSWQAYLQTAALSGQVDILLHGASVTAVSEPLNPYLEAEPEILEQVGVFAVRKNEKVEGYTYKDFITYGISITANPIIVVIDTKILDDYGVELPDNTWTLDDIMSIAEKCTGTDPVTGTQTYGISLINAAQSYKNFIWASRAVNDVVFDYGDTIKESKVTFNTEKTIEVLQYLADLEQYSHPDYLEGLDLTDLYTENNVLAMTIVEGPYDAYNNIKANGQEDRYMFLQLPLITDGEYAGQSASHIGDWNLAICNTSSQKEIAWEFLKFMATDEVVTDWVLRTKAIPSNIKGLDGLADYMPEQYYTPIKEVISNFSPTFSLQANASYNSIDFGAMSDNIGIDLNEMYVGNMTAEEAAKDVQDKVDEFMSSLE